MAERADRYVKRYPLIIHPHKTTVIVLAATSNFYHGISMVWTNEILQREQDLFVASFC